MTSKRPTIDDVASRSGVARVTVSRVLNGGKNVRAEVRERVLKAVEELDYTVNMQARTLAGGGTSLITLVHPVDDDTEPNSYWESALEIGALRACADLGVQLVTQRIPKQKWTKRDWVVDLIDRNRTDGIILTPPFSDDIDLRNFILAKGSHLTCIAPGPTAAESTASVRIHDERAGFEIAEYLLNLGHRRFAFIGGPSGHVSAARRGDGVFKALNAAGIEMSDIVVRNGDFTFKAGVDLTPEILSQDPRPTALICANDDMAVGALFAAHRVGLDIPADLSITGFDDTPVSALIWPPLTTIHQPIREMGYKAVELVTEQLRNRRQPEVAHHEILEHGIVERQSTAAPYTYPVTQE